MNNKGISVDYYFNEKYTFSYLSINSAFESLGISKNAISNSLKNGTSYKGHSFKINLKTNPFIVTTALIRAVSKTTFLRMNSSNKEYYINKIINKAKSIIDLEGEKLITEENVFDIKTVSHDDLKDVVSALLEELI